MALSREATRRQGGKGDPRIASVLAAAKMTLGREERLDAVKGASPDPERQGHRRQIDESDGAEIVGGVDDREELREVLLLGRNLQLRFIQPPFEPIQAVEIGRLARGERLRHGGDSRRRLRRPTVVAKVRRANLNGFFRDTVWTHGDAKWGPGISLAVPDEVVQHGRTTADGARREQIALSLVVGMHQGDVSVPRDPGLPHVDSGEQVVGVE